MEVVALVGASGTGKSHRALQVAREHHADVIIDDGILIKDGHIIAGKSAKNEKNKIMSIRRAIFVLPDHAEEVCSAIQKVHPNKILIIGTSLGMIHKIIEKLNLPAIKLLIKIEEIASPKEIKKAQFQRRKQGKHIIPVPTIELRPHFSGYLIHPVQSLFHKSAERRNLSEKSIVRPIFSYYGKLIIDDRVIVSIVEKIAQRYEFIKTIQNIQIKHLQDNEENFGLQIFCDVVLIYCNNIPKLIRLLQSNIHEAIEFTTGMIVLNVDIHVRSLYIEKRNLK